MASVGKSSTPLALCDSIWSMVVMVIDMLLLIDDILDKRMHLAIGKRIEAHHKRVGIVIVGRCRLVDERTVGPVVSAMP